LNVEIFVRDVFDVAAMDARQRVEVGLGPALELDALKIGWEVQPSVLM
jgi:hypothetical protein